MGQTFQRLAIIGQGLIGSSITRAVAERGGAREVVVTDQSEKVRRRVLELGLQRLWRRPRKRLSAQILFSFVSPLARPAR